MATLKTAIHGGFVVYFINRYGNMSEYKRINGYDICSILDGPVSVDVDAKRVFLFLHYVPRV